MESRYEIKKLPYDYDSLEPYIDEETMKIHHDKHHKAYADKFNAAIDAAKISESDPAKLLADWNKIPKDAVNAVRNFGGGALNHDFFWEILAKGKEFKGDAAEAIKKKFGSFEKFKAEFSKAANTLFGSGWAWLVVNEKKELEIMQTFNQDTPISFGKIPLLCIDVWEHAYYLKYQNRRNEFVEAFFSIINWEKVSSIYAKAVRKA